MNNTAKKPLPPADPAGLDQMLMAAGKGVARFLEGAVEKRFGMSVSLWDGQDGLGAVLEEHLKAAGVPNKRFPDLLTPRAVLLNFSAGKKRRPRRKAVR